MSSRKIIFLEDEYYHIFNRGVDKRIIFQDQKDFNRFLLSMIEFNSVDTIGSIFENSFRKRKPLGNGVSKYGKKTKEIEPLVEYIAFCLNPNHFHLIVRQISEKGIEKLMHRLGLGYTKYFNERNKRSGALFQGPFKAVHIENNEQLLYLSVYVNLNNRVHKIADKRCVSSWPEYRNNRAKGICNKGIILSQFKNKDKYEKESEELVRDIQEKREDMKSMFLEELGNGVS